MLRQVGQVAYELELPEGCKVHPIFHVSLLRKAEGLCSAEPPPPLPLTADWELDLQPESVLAHRWSTSSGSATLELLIHWKHRPSTEDSWEEYDLMLTQFPHFRLEDKAVFQGEGIDMILSKRKQPMLTYSRRKKPKIDEAQPTLSILQLLGITSAYMP